MSDLILLKVWIFITQHWTNVCLCVYRVPAKTQRNSCGFRLTAGRNPQSWQRLATALSQHPPLPPSTHLTPSTSLLFFFPASGPQQDDYFNINHSHTPCKTHEREKQSKKDKRERHRRWILINSFKTKKTIWLSALSLREWATKFRASRQRNLKAKLFKWSN